MKRKLLIGLLAVGTVGGFASGFASLRRCHHHRKAAFEEQVTEICAEAARRAQAPEKAVE